MMNGSMLFLLAKTSRDGGLFDIHVFYLILILIGTFLLIFLLIMMRKNLFPAFKLWYIILVHGRYSFEFIEFFKEKNLRNPHNNCIRDEITLHFLLFFKKIRNSGEYTTQQRIEFGDVPFLTSYRHLLKTKGNPDCINVTRFQSARVKVIGYNNTLLDVKIKSLYYFVGEYFVLGEYFISDITRVKPDRFLEAISIKYLDGAKPPEDSWYITDPQGNRLNYENNGFSLYVRYLCMTHPETNQVLSKICGKSGHADEKLKSVLQQEELYGRF